MPDLKVPATIGTMKTRLIWVERASIGQRANRNFNANGAATHSPRERIILRTVQAIAGAVKLSEILQVLNLISENKQKGFKTTTFQFAIFFVLLLSCKEAKVKNTRKESWTKDCFWKLKLKRLTDKVDIIFKFYSQFVIFRICKSISQCIFYLKFFPFYY